MGSKKAPACHKCPRRRLKCDRTLPTCEKCRQTGQECLGYGKLFLWNQGVASRGKMMGKSYPPPASHLPEETRIDHRSESGQYANVPLPLIMLDPLLKGLDVSSRRYLFHCTDMVISDITDAHPFRNLIPLAKDHPILLHAIVANAALHVSSSNTSTNTAASSNTMVDALSAKHKALVLLRRALADIHNIDVNLVVTIVHLFITFELIGPGEGEWRAHVQGAMRLISYLQTLELCDASSLAIIRASFTSDCLTFYFLGCTLMNTGTLSDPFSFEGDIIEVLTRAVVNSYLSLPTPLLQILFKACELSNRIAGTSMNETANCAFLFNEANTLLRAVQAFDVNAWAEGLEGNSSARTLSRVHTALAHQNAMRIYICRSVDHIAPLGEDTEALVTNMVCHLSFVGVDDPIFKATSWPTFIAGAETDNPVYRQWALDRLHEFWNLSPWGYLKTAVEVMQTTWRLRDASGRGAAERSVGSSS
ncbi:fungal-specific transcription factor domain-containing protein [Aspergillus spectabilis]